MRFLFLAAMLGAALTPVVGLAQVASHAPTMPGTTAAAAAVPANAAPGSIMEVTGKPVARVNGAVLTDRDLLREMFAMFPYARVTQWISQRPGGGDPPRRAGDDRV